MIRHYCLNRVFLTFFISSYGFIFSLFAIPSLEEKVGQMLIVHFNGSVPNENARKLIEEYFVGGIIYYNFSNDLSCPKNVFLLSLGLQKMAEKTPLKIPLFIAVDQEGGRVNRLKNGFTQFPGNGPLGRIGDFLLAEKCAYAMGKEMECVGVNLNLAPVVDVNIECANPVIGIRSFGSNPDTVSSLGKAMVQGFKKSGIISVLKHFPGHGDVVVDSHEALPVIKKDKEMLQRCELIPFTQLCHEADVIMTAHLLVPALDPKYCATLSKKIVEDLLKNEIGFSGLIMTDSLAMRGVLDQCENIEEAVLKSIESGHDLILLGGKQLLASQEGFEFTLEDIAKIHAHIVRAVKEGKLSEKRIDQSFERIVNYKHKYALFQHSFSEDSYFKEELKTKENCELAYEIAKKSLVIHKKGLPLSRNNEGTFVVVAPDLLKEEIEQTAWKDQSVYYFKGLQPTESEMQSLLQQIKPTPSFVFFSYNAWQFTEQRELFNRLKEKYPENSVICVRDPHDVDLFSSAENIISTLSPSLFSLQSAFEALYR